MPLRVRLAGRPQLHPRPYRFRSRHGGFNITAAGRVQTPTLAILAQREREIKAFEPRDYWEVQADFAVTRGNYEGRWFDPEFTKSEEEPKAALNESGTRQMPKPLPIVVPESPVRLKRRKTDQAKRTPAL